MTPISKLSYDKVCAPGTVGVYEIINADLVKGNTSVRVVGHGFPGLFGQIATGGMEYGVDFKLYKSKKEYDTRSEAQKAKNADYIELKKTPGGFQEIVVPTEGKFIQFKLELIDKKTGKKIKDIILVPDGVRLLNEIG